jgi:ribose 5-phosphate isomerase A
MRTQPYVLILLSSSRQLTLRDGDLLDCGFWAEEFLTPWKILRDSGWPVVLATPDGQPPQVDPESLQAANLDGDSQRVEALLAELRDLAPLLSTVQDIRRLDDELLHTLRGLFIPGGNGPLQDLPGSAALARLLCYCEARGTPVATLCHGSAALLATTTDDRRAFSGYTVSCFSKAEEENTRLSGRWPFHLEEALRAMGFQTDLGPAWSEHWVQDRLLLSGQNPASAAALTRAFVAQLEAIRHHKGSRHGR